jgi:hypothetical protein
MGTLTDERPTIRASRHVAVLAALVLLADILLFRQGFGINLFLFAIAVSAGILLSARARFNPRAAGLWIGFVAFGSLPLVIGPSLSGMTVAVVAVLLIALSASRLWPGRPARLPLILCRFLALVPTRFFVDMRRRSARMSTDAPFRMTGAGLAVWILPLVFASVFLVLFAMANPVIDDVLRSIDLLVLWRLLDFWRITFWLAVTICVWAVLRPRLLRMRKRRVAEQSVRPASENVLLSHGSILRSLVIFNAMFAIQTLLDLLYLWGGASLPDGMTHAQYAHRGAYPLIATALLAGAFVLVAMRRDGPGDGSAAIRHLVHLWIGQNILLCLSAILRLDLYVEVYSLTELRVAAGIWMGLVAIGLGLILLRILLRRSNEWLIAMNLASLTIVLYATALVDVPGFIARFNVEHSLEVAGEGVSLDLDYLRTLGPSAVPALDIYVAALPRDNIVKLYGAESARRLLVKEFDRASRDWRSWSMRSAGLAEYFDTSFAPQTKHGINSLDDIKRQL